MRRSWTPTPEMDRYEIMILNPVCYLNPGHIQSTTGVRSCIKTNSQHPIKYVLLIRTIASLVKINTTSQKKEIQSLKSPDILKM